MYAYIYVYIHIYIYVMNKYILDIYIFNSWNIVCNPGFRGVFLQNNNHQAVN